jgi:ligand-binding sensor domain-containing protein
VAVDPKGNVWVGSDGGLSKFDGTTWRNYNSNNSGLPYAQIKTIAFDAASNVWLALWPGGVTKFDGTTWTTFTHANSALSSDMVNAVALDHLGNVWAGTQNMGVCKYDGTKWTVINASNSGLKSDFVMSMGVDADGSIWMGTMDKGINVLTESTTAVEADRNGAPGMTGDRSLDQLFYCESATSQTAAIRCRLASRSHVRLSLHDLAGRERLVLADAVMEAGEQVQPLDWPAHNLASGMYFIRMATERGVVTQKAPHLR